MLAQLGIQIWIKSQEYIANYPKQVYSVLSSKLNVYMAYMNNQVKIKYTQDIRLYG